MRAKAAAEELVDRGEGSSDLGGMQTWGKERAVRAAVLRHLLVEGQCPVAAKGVRLRGVRITGHLDLEGAVLRCPLSLDWCYLDADVPVCLDQATASRVTLTSCRLVGLTGVMLTARELDLSHSTLTGPLRLAAAGFTGQVRCHGTQLTGTDSGGNALFADMMKVSDSVYLDNEFTAAGTVRLAAADIKGQLVCRDARLTGHSSSGNNVLVADWMKASAVFLDGGFTATGAIRLSNADITGQLNCRAPG